MDSLIDCTDYRWGVDLYNGAYYWEAHEAWEQLWRCSAEPAARELLQGLIQCAGAALKAAMDQPDACRRLIAKGLAHLDRVPDRSAGLDLQAYARAMNAFDGRCPAAVPPLALAR